MVMLLLENGADVEISDHSGRNAMMEAAANNDSDILEALLARRAGLNSQDSMGRSALIEACAEGNTVVVFQLLATLGVSPDENSDLFSSPFIADKGETTFNIYPDNNKLNLDLQDWDGRSALLCACEEGHTEIALALIRSGADLSLSSKASENTSEKCFGRTPLIEACERGLGNVVSALVSCGANLNQGDSRGRTALIAACMWGHDDIAKGLSDFHVS
jgi:ankyrin repeat protein